MKGVAKAISIIVLSGISIFFTVLYLKTFVLVEAEGLESKGVQTVATSDGTDIEKTPTVNPPQEAEKTEVPVAVYRSLLPRAATSLDGGAINNVGGYSDDELLESYCVGKYYYAIIQGESDNCDLSCKEKNIAVARFDTALCLRECITFSSLTAESYMCSSLYDDGILITAKSANKTTVYALSFDMKLSKIILPVAAQSAFSYYTSSGIVLALLGDNAVNVYCLSADLSPIHNLSFSSKGVTTAKAMYRNGDFILFANGASGAYAFVFSFESLIKSIELPYINDILPTGEGYLLASVEKGEVIIYRYSYDLEKKTSQSLTAGSSASLSYSDNGYFVLVYGENTPTVSYFLCKHFDVISVNRNDFDTLESVSEITYVQGKIYVCAQNRSYGNIYVYDTNAHYAEKKISLSGGCNTNLYTDAEGDILIYCTNACIKEHAANWGEGDIWIRRITE